MRANMRWTTVKGVAVVVGLFATGFGVVTAVLSAETSAAPLPAFIPPTAGWLTTVNYYREMAGVAPVAEDPAMSSGAAAHSCYMLQNGVAHDEDPSLPGYTPEGDAAGRNGDVAVSSVINTSERSHLELWMSGPFHAIGVIRPNLRSTGFGKCDRDSTPTPWHSAATLDVIRGLDTSAPRPSEPILFPGNGTTTNLYRFVTESPDPLSFCGWTGPAGLPIIALMPETATNPGAALNGPNGPIEVCVLSAANTTGAAQQILAGDNAVVVVPRVVLDTGAYTVDVATTARNVPWSFRVDPSAAIGLAPVPVAKATASPSGYTPLAPARIVDTRIALGSTLLLAQTPRRIQITGTGGVPASASAVQLNVTVTGPTGSGFLTVWNSCTTPRPEVSTVNFAKDAVVANAATIPLASDGSLCIFSNVSTDVVIGVSGYFSTTGAGRFTPVKPVRLMDSRGGLGTPARLVGGQTVELSVVGGSSGIPTTTSAVALNVTGILPSADGFITVFPCGALPGTSSLNPSIGRVTPNLVMARISSRGTVCFFSNTDVDLVVDIVGYISPTAANQFTPSVPFRFTDTRDFFRTEVNAGQNGFPLAPSQTLVVQMAGVRGVPSSAKAISANITVVEAAAAGFVTAFPCGGAIPTASNVNYGIGVAIANAAELPLSASGTICVYSSASTQVIIDVNGWWG
ncbi:MAG TPA: CAP domain-containing protein [Ilumatobacteraceae bacterium]|nr:CAP domain-containing protein [Ilumatobacteraceae bacterium]